MRTIADNLYKTTDFQEAIYLRQCGIIFVTTEWFTTKQATFVFKKPPDDILAAWQRGNDNGVRAILDAADFFRDELHRRER